MKVKAEYIWLDGNNPQQLRSKTKILTDKPSDIGFGNKININYFPEWSFDGSSTNQAEGHSSDCLLQPVKFINDPFRKNSYLVLCEVWDRAYHNSSNKRWLIENDSDDYWFGFEQEYFLTQNGIPLGFPEDGSFPKDQGDFYCGLGNENVKGREIVEEHLDACLEAGLDIKGINAEVCIGQWEYQLFGKGAKNAADDLWLSRYLLYRVAEKYDVEVELHPKPIGPNSGYQANGSGMHVNFSNGILREIGGKEYTERIMKEFKKYHNKHIKEYGKDNHQRLTGDFETQNISKFSFGISDRGASIRIPINVADNDFAGYLEDRRPASNANPYDLTRLIVERLESIKEVELV